MNKTNQVKNILYYGDFDCTTGFANVSNELINYFSKIPNVFITVLALNNHKKEPYNVSDNVYVIPALATKEEGDKDVYARKTLLKMLYNGSYDLFFCINDVEIFNEMDEHLRKVRSERKKNNKKSFKSMIYFPIDSEPRKSDLKVLDFFDEVVNYTEYAKSVVKNLTEKSHRAIPHGCNLKDFYKKDVSELKKKLFGDKFVFGSVNRNSMRKDYSTLIMAYAKFHKKDKTVLYLHCNPNDPFGINMERLCERLDLKFGVDVMFPEKFNENQGYTVADLNDLYNCFDTSITTTTAEGFGLSITESIATETLLICPLHTSINEISNFGKNVIGLTTFEPVVFQKDFEKIRHKSLVYEVVDAMNIAYNIDPKLKAQKIKDAKDFISLNYNWEKSANAFITLIKGLLKIR
jgi:glycosyltransferase involved in cell wall biosynthesis